MTLLIFQYPVLCLWALGCGLPAGMGLTQGVVRLEPSA